MLRIQIIQGKQVLKEEMKNLTFMGLNHLPADGVRSFISAGKETKSVRDFLE